MGAGCVLGDKGRVFLKAHCIALQCPSLSLSTDPSCLRPWALEDSGVHPPLLAHATNLPTPACGSVAGAGAGAGGVARARAGAGAGAGAGGGGR